MVQMRPGYYVLVHQPTKKIYIGSSGNLYFRIKNHQYQLRDGVHANPRLQEIYVRWEDFFIIVKYTETKEQALKIEDRLLKLNRHNPNLCNISTNAYNSLLCNGALEMALKSDKLGKHWIGRNHSEESRAKMSAAHRENPRTYTEEERRKNSERMKGNTYWVGRKHTPEAIQKTASAKWKPVSIEGKTFPSVGHAAVEFGISRSSVGNRIKSEAPEWTDWKRTPS